jgi:hypothetical protein
LYALLSLTIKWSSSSFFLLACMILAGRKKTVMVYRLMMAQTVEGTQEWQILLLFVLINQRSCQPILYHDGLLLAVTVTSSNGLEL